MKKNILLLLTTLIIITASVLTGCSNPVLQGEQAADSSTGRGTIQLSWTTANQAGSRNALSRANSLLDAAKVVISIEATDGTAVYSQKQLNLYNFNGSFISEPISLKVGSYRLTDYLVLNQAGTVIYATPKEGSAKAHLVRDPLPINFTVTKDSTTKVIPEVIDVTEVAPADFGYATFSFTEAKVFNFLVSVMVYDLSTDNFVLTDAVLDVSADAQSYSFNLAKVTNNIAINDINTNYYLTIRKAGYEDYLATYTNAEMKAFFQSPLVVVLNEKQAPVNTVITFADPGLEAAVRAAISKPAGDIYANDVVGLTRLDAEGRNISNLSGVENLTSLTTLILRKNNLGDISLLSSITNMKILDLYSNNITDISPLSSMTHLTTLDLYFNSISDISPLSSMTNMNILSIGNNRVSDITPLSSMIKMEILQLEKNRITDIAPISSMTNLIFLHLGTNNITDITPLVNNTGISGSLYLVNNPLNTNARNVQIPALIARGISINP